MAAVAAAVVAARRRRRGRSGCGWSGRRRCGSRRGGCRWRPRRWTRRWTRRGAGGHDRTSATASGADGGRRPRILQERRQRRDVDAAVELPRRRAGVLLRDLRGSVAAGHDLVRQHVPGMEPRRGPHLVAGRHRSSGVRGELHSRRSPRSAIRSHQQGSPDHRERRRRLRDLRPRQDLRESGPAGNREHRTGQVLREPADHAVLSRVGRQRAAVLHGVRRHAGQLLDMRSGANELIRWGFARATGTS